MGRMVVEPLSTSSCPCAAAPSPPRTSASPTTNMLRMKRTSLFVLQVATPLGVNSPAAFQRDR